MDKQKGSAVLYLNDKDGEFSATLKFYDENGDWEATTSCPSWEQVLLRASKYPGYIRVEPHEGLAFRLRMKSQKLNGHSVTKIAGSNDIKVNGHCPHHYDGTGSLIQSSRPQLPDGVAYDYWKGQSKKIKF